MRAATALTLSLLLCNATAAPLVLEGLNGRERDNVLAFLGYDAESCDSPAWRLEALYAQADRRIREALEAFGYYDPEIESALGQVDGCLQARFRISRGEPVRYRTVSVEIRGPGAGAAHWQALLATNPLVSGRRLNHADYTALRQRIDSTARRFGYFDGEFETRRIEVHPEELAADVTLHFQTGERYSFGELQIEQDVIRDSLLRRYLRFAPGDPFDADQIAELYEALLLSNFFSTVDIRSEPQTDGSRTVTTLLTAMPALPTTWTAGLGYGTDTGPQVRLGYLNRRRNDRGHQWSASTSISEVIKQASLGYRLPLADPRTEWLSVDLGYQDETTDTSSSELVKLGVKRQKQRGTRWLETQFIDISREKFELADSSGNTFLVVPRISWSTFNLSVLTRPTSGQRLTLQVSGTTEAIGSDVSFVQTFASGKIVRPLPAEFRLLARGELGTTWLQELQDLPASLRYFAGGDFSVRGYDYKTLGPRDDEGNVTGGENLLTASVEIDRLVRGNWALAAFADAGNAFNRFNDMRLQFSVGAGVRWFSPVGPIRFDVAFPLDSEYTDDNFRIHITLSPDL